MDARLTLRGYLCLGSHEKHFPYFKMSIIMALLKQKSYVNLNFHSSFLVLHKGAFSVSKRHFSTSRRAIPGFTKGVAQKFLPDPLILTDIVHQSQRKPGSAPDLIGVE